MPFASGHLEAVVEQLRVKLQSKMKMRHIAHLPEEGAEYRRNSSRTFRHDDEQTSH